MKIEELYQYFLNCSSIAIDTRKITANSLFFALNGEKYDANKFAIEALKLGATYVVIDNNDYFIDHRTILVDDSLQTLQQLATYHRVQLNLPIIALTGSNGKTTSKELINVVLSQKFNVGATVGNLNNHIGVPLTLLTFNKNTEIGIVEMGANHQKEIEFLCQITKPDYGYITNFGKAHLEGFGGAGGVIKGKSEMYTFLIDNNKKIFVNLDDAVQNEKTVGLSRISFSEMNSSANVLLSNCMANPFVNITYDGVIIQSNLIGIYNCSNIGVAITIGNYFGVSNNAIKQAIESYVPDNNRSQLINKNSNTIILDAYNANPSSMQAALANFVNIDNENKIVILGDMFELGLESESEHKSLVGTVFKYPNITFYLVEPAFYNCKIDSAHINFFENFESLSAAIIAEKIVNSTILIKGSRGMALERILDFL
ncbi:MAG: UDP-N-acetylmuramoyl-tripeptide--D-alanyl-D-alanine ligase [Flavobacterium sp.]|nr:UDP-N-acetylmuramoyl-tripeptide--D-alanyl-D-alanine ligase [Flavobacterium sp.]